MERFHYNIIHASLVIQFFLPQCLIIFINKETTLEHKQETNLRRLSKNLCPGQYQAGLHVSPYFSTLNKSNYTVKPSDDGTDVALGRSTMTTLSDGEIHTSNYWRILPVNMLCAKLSGSSWQIFISIRWQEDLHVDLPTASSISLLAFALSDSQFHSHLDEPWRIVNIPW